MLKPSPSSVSKMGNSLIRTRFSSSRLHSISGTTQGIDMVPNNFQIELKGLPIATSQFTGVKHVTHRETGWENSGSKETGLEYDGFTVYVHFLNLGNLELEKWGGSTTPLRKGLTKQIPLKKGIRKQNTFEKGCSQKQVWERDELNNNLPLKKGMFHLHVFGQR